MEPPRLDFSAPPPYEDCNSDFVKLPTYEEVQLEKRLEGETSPRLPVIINLKLKIIKCVLPL